MDQALKDKGRLAAVAVLRAASIGLGFALWLLARWLWHAQPAGSSWDPLLATTAATLSAAFVILGALAADRAVRMTWKTIGKVAMLAFMFT